VKSVREHYDEFLGPVYSWILGDFDIARQRNETLFRDLDLAPRNGDVAVDLGAGPGCQSLPLAERGYRVLAIDFCASLVTELAQHAGDLPVRAVCDDLTGFRSHMPEPADLIVCMGDTLVHLSDEATVDRLIDDVCESLNPGGRFIYSIRDYFSVVPEGADRFIPIRSSESQIFTCFLDYLDDVVHVHDVLHEKGADGWRMSISDYKKLRLDTANIDARLRRGGLEMTDRRLADGMIVGMAEKPA
jgi:2-polyprenyl-3-methyl-5-hydroxy-6-metoxy-1,4-benzoquinol methylase